MTLTQDPNLLQQLSCVCVAYVAYDFRQYVVVDLPGAVTWRLANEGTAESILRQDKYNKESKRLCDLFTASVDEVKGMVIVIITMITE